MEIQLLILALVLGILFVPPVRAVARYAGLVVLLLLGLRGHDDVFD